MTSLGLQTLDLGQRIRACIYPCFLSKFWTMAQSPHRLFFMKNTLQFVMLLPLLFLMSCSHGSKQTHVPTLNGKPPIIIAHRGASGYKPEHTIASYELAIQLGADFIEPDLVSTKDGILIARHENEISGTTDVAERFPKLKKTKKIDGEEVTGWFTEDLTYKEIQTLKVKERLPFRSQVDNGKFSVPTFLEILAFVRVQEKALGKKIGVYPELKHPTYFKSLGMSPEKKILSDLKKAGFTSQNDSVFIQSFESAVLKWLAKNSSWPLVQLLEKTQLPYDLIVAKDARTVAEYISDEGLQEIRTYAIGIGPDKRMIIDMDQQTKLMPPSNLVKRAHHIGLMVHPYTFRAEQNFLAKEYSENPDEEYQQFFRLGVDGVFTDFTDQAVKAREKYLKANQTQ